MRYAIADKDLRAIDADEHHFARRWDRPIQKAFRKVMALIVEARDERELRTVKALRLEKLSGDRAGQHSMRLNRQFRLIVRFQIATDGQEVVVIEIVDYH